MEYEFKYLPCPPNVLYVGVHIVQIRYDTGPIVVTRWPANGAARKLSLSAWVTTRIAVRVIVFNTLWNERLQAAFRIRLANWLSLELV